MRKWPPRLSPGSPPRWFGVLALDVQPGYLSCVMTHTHYVKRVEIRYVT